jgi:hypothetical protein
VSFRPANNVKPWNAKSRTGSLKGDDAFDAVVGLFGMLEVVLGRREPGESKGEQIRDVEGWILGQAART